MKALIILLLSFFPSIALASGDTSYNFGLTDTYVGPVALTIFVLAYLLVMLEEKLELRKSKPVLLCAGVIWAFIAYYCQKNNLGYDVHAAMQANILEYCELFLFLLVAMTYVNALEERKVFEGLRTFLTQKNMSFRQLFWVTGTLSFLISPIADNLTTALLMCAVVIAVAPNNKKFVSLSCINIVVGANAGGAFSPFGDITTLMVWQDKLLHFYEFFHIFIPSLINFLVPAIIMSFAVPSGAPKSVSDSVFIKHGGITIIFLFLATICTAVLFHNVFEIPAAAGMVTGLSYLQFYAFYLKKRFSPPGLDGTTGAVFDVFKKIQRAEWDTLLFFYGVIISVGGLATIGYLELMGSYMYESWDFGLSPHHLQTPANIAVGFLSSIVDNIPVMYAVLTIHPDMSHGQWLLVTLTAGVGGSLLSVGSAAGVALMGQSRGMYTFFEHFKWSWAILLGYILSIASHIYINGDLFLMYGDVIY
ncbi:MAG: sodium:proton antiporter [Legionellales bacterium]|nr:sodium:proton antiporter [Legionellales bacterium]